MNFNFNFNYYGTVYTRCCISINGYISFDDVATSSISPSNNYFIAPFSYNLDTTSTYNGNIYYRSTNDSQILNQIELEINSYFLPMNAFIVTWERVAPSFSWFFTPNGYVSFQIVISTDGSNSFLTINYGTLNFSASGGYYFQCGSFSACYTGISNTNPELSSNVGVNGKWIFNISNYKFKNIKIQAFNLYNFFDNN